METGPLSPGAWHRLTDWLTGAVGLGGLVSLIRLWQNRKRPASDARLVDSQADERSAAAEAVRADSDMKLVREIYALHRQELERLATRIKELEAERDANRDVVRLAEQIVRSERKG